jgi:hypothetical protein
MWRPPQSEDVPARRVDPRLGLDQHQFEIRWRGVVLPAQRSTLPDRARAAVRARLGDRVTIDSPTRAIVRGLLQEHHIVEARHPPVATNVIVFVDLKRGLGEVLAHRQRERAEQLAVCRVEFGQNHRM